MSTTIEKRYERPRLTPEEIDRRIAEGMRRDFQEFKDIWLPLMLEQRRLAAEAEDDQEAASE